MRRRIGAEEPGEGIIQMRFVKKLPSLVLWLYAAAIVIPESRVDRHLPGPAATMVNATFGLVERGAAAGFDAVKHQIDQPEPATDG